MKFLVGNTDASVDLLAAVAWKSLVMLALAWGVMILWRRRAAAARHLAWTMTFLCLLALPFFVKYLSVWRPPVWMTSSRFNNDLPDSLKFILGNVPHQKAGTQPSASEPEIAPPASQKISSATAPVKSRVFDWNEMALAVWFAGMAVMLARILAVQIQLHRLTREMRVCENTEQLKILEKLRRDHQIKRPIRLLISKNSASPMTWGIGRPVIALPLESSAWPDERLRVVLRHELAHIKRWDCLTQELAQWACAFYWFNPLAWLAARRMRAEREKACDDFVLNAGARPAEYANHLVEIARQFSAAHLSGAVAMARPSGLESRVTAILDGRCNRNQFGKISAASIAFAIFGLGILIGGCSTVGSQKSWSLKHSAVSAQLKSFIAAKQKQANNLLALDENDYFKRSNASNLKIPDCRPFFTAAAKGDWLSVSNQFQELGKTTAGKQAVYFRGRWWGSVLETYGAMEAFAVGDEKYSKLFGDEIIQSIPEGSIYFGGTDPGRFIVTALQKFQAFQANGKGPAGGNFTNLNGAAVTRIARLNSDGTLDEMFTTPFYTLTQNALADSSYLDYLRSMYDGEIYVPTAGDAQKAFQDYTQAAQLRSKEGRLKPGEDIKVTEGRVQVSGYVAVMEINGLLVKTIFDKNPNREFYIEESFPLDWMYPYLEPHGLIFKLNRQPLPELSGEIVQRDHDYWTKMIQPMIGDWLSDDTSVEEITTFAAKVFLRHDFSSFTGDPQFVQNNYSCKMFSKERNSIAGLYVWRMKNAAGSAAKERMAREADFAFRQAWALCPYSPEVVTAYVALLMGENRRADALLVAETAAKMPEIKGRDGDAIRDLVRVLQTTPAGK
jgi:beta-lactamase regulating signal transducer with metallopeptidase domain